MIKKISEIKIKLGSDLVDKLDSTLSKSQGRGCTIGTIIGSVSGGSLGYVFGKDFMNTFFGTYFGLAFGINFGYLFGTIHGNYKLKKLKESFPDVSQEIQDYINYKNICSYDNVRPGVKNIIGKDYLD